MDRDGLVAALTEAQRLGLLGPGPVERHVVHAEGLAAIATDAVGGAPGRLIDLGAGGGVPGLVLADAWRSTEVVLLDSMRRRTDFLRRVVTELGFGHVDVVCARAEDAARDPAQRETFDLVTARSFARPSVTSECAAGFARVGGVAVFADAPGQDDERWQAERLAALGWSPARRCTVPVHATVLQKVAPVGPSVPRRAGVLQKRPLW